MTTMGNPVYHKSVIHSVLNFGEERFGENKRRFPKVMAAGVLLVLAAAAAIASDHSPLLPRPQKIRYGSGQLPIRVLVIRFASAPDSDDEFAARELGRLMMERAGITIPLRHSTGGKAIVLSRTGRSDPLPLPGEQPGPASREYYRVSVTADGAEIRAPSSAGIFYGVQTLVQLIERKDAEPYLPEVEIEDWPVLAYRGPMVDMSHGPLPTEQEVERQLDFLARFKTNQYFFYSEASIELEGFPLLNPKGRFTKDQVRRIIDYGRQRHIDVVPCLELYGHLHDLFRVEQYSDLAALPHGGEFNPANPNVKALLADWANQLSDLFPSRFVHIGFDETWQIERAARQQGMGATPAQLYLQQLNAVVHLFEERGKRAMAWSDMMVKFPEVLDGSPRGLIAVAWYYEASPDPEYKKWLGPLAAKNFPHFTATGVHSWNEIAPDFETTFENVDTFLAAGRKSGALGLVQTVWSDDAQILMRMSWPGMAYGVAAPWQTEPVDRARFFSEYAQVVFPRDVAAEAAAGISSLAAAEASLQKVLGQETMLALWDNPFAPAALKRSAEHREDLRRSRTLAEDAQGHFQRALTFGGERTTFESFLLGGRLIDYAGEKNLYALEIAEFWQRLGPRPTGSQWWNDFESEVYAQSHGRAPDLMEAISELRESYRSAWLAEYTPYRLASALGRWDHEFEYWRRLQARFRAFAKTFGEGISLPPLDSFTHDD